MTQDDIIEMARQAGLHLVGTEHNLAYTEVIEAFAKLVEERTAVKEREACAKVCDTEWNGDSDTFEYAVACNECAEAIRARGEA
jgi:PHP family Zn ribbon phosphoesterase